MNVNLYLPDDIGEQAKAAELPLSRLLRDVVIDELERRTAVSGTLEEVETYEFDIEDPDGNVYVGRITGKSIATDGRDEEIEVFLTDDKRVIVYNESTLNYWVLDDPVRELRDVLSNGPYADALYALGEKPVIDL